MTTPLNPTSKMAAVMRDLLTGHVLTETKAYARYGIVSLAQTISRLRARGAPIQTRLIPFLGPTGNRSRFAEYFIPASALPLAKLQFQTH